MADRDVTYPLPQARAGALARWVCDAGQLAHRLAPTVAGTWKWCWNARPMSRAWRQSWLSAIDREWSCTGSL